MGGMSYFGNINSNMQLGSYKTEKEIFKIKDKLEKLIMRLVNTHNIEEEISINDKIKNETEFLSSLLTIKINELNQNNHMNNTELQQLEAEIMEEKMKQRQMMQQQIFQQQQQMEQDHQEDQMQYISNENISTEFTVVFRAKRVDGKEAHLKVQYKPNDKVSKIIEEYRRQSGDKDYNKKFIFNAMDLNNNLNLSAAEAGLFNNSNIFVIATLGKKEG